MGTLTVCSLRCIIFTHHDFLSCQFFSGYPSTNRRTLERRRNHAVYVPMANLIDVERYFPAGRMIAYNLDQELSRIKRFLQARIFNH